MLRSRRRVGVDVATGPGVSPAAVQNINGGKIVGVDQRLRARVGHKHEEPIPSYVQSAGEADKLPFKTNTFDRAFVSFSLHHFSNPSGVVGEVLRVLKNGGRFVVLDPIIEEAKDSVDIALEAKINQVFRRTHGEEFRYHTASSIQRLLTKAGYRVPRTTFFLLSFIKNADGIPTACTGSKAVGARKERGSCRANEKLILAGTSRRSRARKAFPLPLLRREAGVKYADDDSDC